MRKMISVESAIWNPLTPTLSRWERGLRICDIDILL